MKRFREIVQIFENHKEYILADYLRHQVSVLSLRTGHMALWLLDPLKHPLPGAFGKLLALYTGTPWTIEAVDNAPSGCGSLAAWEQASKKEFLKQALEDAGVKKVTELFPQSTVTIE